jgi:hypothetical protein
LLLLASAALAWGQGTSTKTLAAVGAAADLELINIGVRTVTDIKVATVDAAARTLTLGGTAAQVELSEWLFRELDGAGPARGHAAKATSFPDARGETAVRVLYFGHAGSINEIQETATLMRTISDIRRLVVVAPRMAVVLRGTPEQADLAAWMFEQVDRAGTPGSRERYQVPNEREGVVRLFTLAHAKEDTAVQELSTAVRTLVGVRRLYPRPGGGALAARGTIEEIEMAEWLIDRLDGPADEVPAANAELAVRGSGEILRLLYLPGATRDSLVQLAGRIQARTGVGRMFVYQARGVLGLRGSVEDVLAAERLAR